MIFIERTAAMPIVIPKLRRRVTGFLAALTIASATLTATGTPARASDDTLLKLLLGATAVAIVVHAASRSQSRQSHVQPSHPRGLPQYCRETLGIHRRHVSVYNAQCLQQAGLRNLPQRCYEVVRTNYGNRGVYRAQCLERHYAPQRPGRAAQGLPRWCGTQYTSQGQRFRGYRADCLQDAGVRSLPSSCLIRGHGGQIYSASCLGQHGHRYR